MSTHAHVMSQSGVTTLVPILEDSLRPFGLNVMRHTISFTLMLLAMVVGTKSSDILDEQGYERTNSTSSDYGIPRGECIRWHPDRQKCTCEPGQILDCLGWFGYADGCICTQPCKEESDCPNHPEANSNPYCRGGFCMLGCSKGEKCPKDMECRFHWTWDCLSASDK